MVADHSPINLIKLYRGYNMKGHTFTVTDQVTGQSFDYKRYAPSGAYYMRSQGDSAFRRVTRDELFKSLSKASVRNAG